MRKQHVLFAALAAAVALSASGCKSREKIDLDTLHTSEAETMASTEASGGDKEKETEKETQKETEKETEETQKGADSSSSLSVRSKIATEKQGKTSIEYAVLSNLRDPKPVFRRSTRKVPSFSSRHFFISFPASRFFLYLQQIFNALLGLFLLKKFF